MAITPDEIRKIRSDLSFTQSELAEQMGLTRDAIAQWETGRCSPRGPAEILLRQMAANKAISATIAGR